VLAREEASVMTIPRFDKALSEEGKYARREDFVNAFECERASLRKLALLLTGKAEMVDRCLIHAFRDCIANDSVCKGWTLTWSRRMVIRNAISIVVNTDNGAGKDASDNENIVFLSLPLENSDDLILEPASAFHLSDLDRCVFAICSVERYSICDCALLLGRSIREINEALHRLGMQLEQVSDHSDRSNMSLSDKSTDS
jgi:DNA-directed RNA polymerase specialized sigma24 family protein